MPSMGQQLLNLRAEGGALELLAETIDRALVVNQSQFQGGEGAITSAEIDEWAEQIRSGTRERGVTIDPHGPALEGSEYGYQGRQGEVIGGFEAAEDIRRSIYGYRIGTEDQTSAEIFQETFGLSASGAEAAVRGDPGLYLQQTGGDISASVTAAGEDWPSRYMPPPEGWTKFDIEEDEDVLKQRENALIALKNGFMGELQRIGLDTETINSLWSWVQGRFVSDPTFSAGQAMVEIYDQPAFIKRFPAIAKMRDEKGRRDIPTPEEYLARERWLGQKFEQYGLTALGANLDNLISESYINTIGTAELEERLVGASAMIFQAPEEIKSTFGRWYGPLGDAALMAAFLDPDDTIFGGEWRNWGAMQANVATAEVGGWSKMLLDLEAPVTQDRAERISKLGLGEREIWSRFSTLKEQEDLFSERITETIDLDLVTTGVESAFNLSQDATDLLRRRQETRAAEFQGAGGALLSGTTTGFGAANA